MNIELSPIKQITDLQMDVPLFKGVEVAEALSLSSPTVSRIIEKGEIILDNNGELAVELRTM